MLYTTTSNSTPSSVMRVSWSKVMPSRFITPMLRTFGRSVTEITRDSPLTSKPYRSQAFAASVA